MQLTCPCCFARFPVEAALTDEAARQAVAAALKLPAPLGDLLLRYIGLFRPDKRALSWDRASRLLAELQLPLKSHGYLLEIVAGLASKTEGAAERQIEEQKGYRFHRKSSGGPKAVKDVVDPQARKEKAAAAAVGMKEAIHGRQSE